MTATRAMRDRRTAPLGTHLVLIAHMVVFARGLRLNTVQSQSGSRYEACAHDDGTGWILQPESGVEDTPLRDPTSEIDALEACCGPFEEQTKAPPSSCDAPGSLYLPTSRRARCVRPSWHALRCPTGGLEQRSGAGFCCSLALTPSANNSW